MVRIHAFRHLKKVNIIKYTAILLVTGFLFGGLHCLLAFSFEWYRLEIFNKAGIMGDIIVGCASGGAATVGINYLLSRGKPEKFVNWIKEKADA